MSSDYAPRHRNVTAVLGPTNTGKTHLAIETMLKHESGMIGLPLRLLAREIYDKLVARLGNEKVALITGEEKIKPEGARYWVSTVEAMPRDVTVDFLAIDEIQLAADPERGHVFTDRLLHARGQLETLLLGAGTMRDTIAELVPGTNFIARPRFSKLTYAGEKKITRLPKRTAIVTFSANDVYAIAELIRRQLGGTAVVLGGLSPRTRNAQVALYQSGDVDYMVATDAIGMGLNLDLDHVAFAAVRKFDGQNFRNLMPAELAQVAGRAGRYQNDGSFGVTGDVEPFDRDLVDRLESHTFDPVKLLQWRSRKLDFGSLDALRESLRATPKEARLIRARMADDVLALETVAQNREIADLAQGRDAVSLLWDVCQVPDFRKISSANHAELVTNLFKDLRTGDQHIREDWFAKQVEFSDRTDGDIDTLSNRLSHIRTWTFVANRAKWLKDPVGWQAKTRVIEDALSDALHERLTQRFVDKRTSALMKGMRDKEELKTDIGGDGAIQVENHFVGRLKGFQFYPDAEANQADGVHGKATRSAVALVLAKELGMRARRVIAAKNEAFKINRAAKIVWKDDVIARLEPSENPLKPTLVILADEHLAASDREKVQARLDTWLTEIIAERLKPLVEIANAQDINGLARGIAFQLVENFGALKRDAVTDDIRSLDQPARAALRQYGVRFGAFNIFFPLLLKPASADLTLVLWALKHASAHNLELDKLPDPPRAGLTSVANDTTRPEALYRASGYHVCGPRAVRIDILERLDNLIRLPMTYRANKADPAAKPPKGATGDGAFTVTPEMMSILGCSPDEVGNVLRALGFRSERRRVKPKKVDAPVLAAEDAAAVAPGMETVPGEAATPAEMAPETAVATEASPEPADAQSVAAETAAAQASSQAVSATLAPVEPPAIGPEAAELAAPEPTAPEATAPVEELFEEVWRPRRKPMPQAASGQATPVEGEPQAQRPGRGEGRGRNRGGDRKPKPSSGYVARSLRNASGAAAPGTPPASAAAAAEPQASATVATDAAKPATNESDRKPNRPPERRGYDASRRPSERRPSTPGGTGPGGGNRGDRGGGDRDRDRDRSSKPQRFQSSSPVKKGPDPDSPFAALSALKLELEKRKSEQGS